MKQAYLDCSSGISGDMFLAALIDAGIPVERLFAELKKLTLGFYEFKRTRAVRGGIVGTRVEINVPGAQPHRHLSDIRSLIEKASLPENAAGQALKVFRRLAEVEGKLHNISSNQVHFHEVGAVDAVLDIVGTCVALELLGISELICSPLNVGSGRVNAEHGSLPVPAPATAEILKNIPVYSTGVEGELVTPTGAALVGVLAAGFGPFPAMKIAQIGYGAGEKDFPGHPNIARLFVGEAIEPVTGIKGLPGDEVVSVIETTAENMSPQLYAEFLEQARAEGALDVACSSARLDQNRPGLAISVLCEPGKGDALSRLLFEKTSTRGVRIYEARRKLLEGEKIKVETPADDEMVSVLEATAHELNPPAYAEFLEQALATGALEVTCSPVHLQKNRPGVVISLLCEQARSEALCQLLLEKTSATGVRISEARRKVQVPETAKPEAPVSDEIVSIIEANIDDMSPQLYGYFMERALAAGALDVTCSAAQMKKNRPGLTISILCEPDKTETLSQLLFEQTTTIGVRISEARRKVLQRELVKVETPYGEVQVKVAQREGKVVNAAPEFNDCQRVALDKAVPLKKVIAAAEAAYLQKNEKAPVE